MTTSDSDRRKAALARSLATCPPWEGTPACWSWPVPSEPVEMYVWQARRCAICGYDKGSLVTDHDHETGLVRGLLCQSCNTREGGDKRPAGILGRYRERNPAVVETYEERVRNSPLRGIGL